jgi:transposase-like protein
MKKTKVFETQFNSLLDLVKRFPDEKSCREYLEKARWGKKPVCVHCGSFRKIYRINDGKLFKCADCRKQFTVRVGTIFEDSALPLQKWLMAIYLITAHKKGISSVQLGKDIGVTQKTAWFVLHRIRYAVRTRAFTKPLNGIVEADETYVGGHHRGGKTGRGSESKTPVFGVIERGGEVAAQVVKHVSKKTLQGIMKSQISRDAIIMTDEWTSYQGLEDTFDSHEIVNHGRKEYVRGDVHTNNIEAFWALLKRGIIGIYHHVDRKHLDKYVDEFEFRYNRRDLKDAERFHAMFNRCAGRLTYSKLIS